MIHAFISCMKTEGSCAKTRAPSLFSFHGKSAAKSATTKRTSQPEGRHSRKHLLLPKSSCTAAERSSFQRLKRLHTSPCPLSYFLFNILPAICYYCYMRKNELKALLTACGICEFTVHRLSNSPAIRFTISSDFRVPGFPAVKRAA